MIIYFSGSINTCCCYPWGTRKVIVIAARNISLWLSPWPPTYLLVAHNLCSSLFEQQASSHQSSIRNLPPMALLDNDCHLFRGVSHLYYLIRDSLYPQVSPWHLPQNSRFRTKRSHRSLAKPITWRCRYCNDSCSQILGSYRQLLAVAAPMATMPWFSTTQSSMSLALVSRSSRPYVQARLLRP